MDHSSALLAHARMVHGVQPEELVLHSDIGGPMKGATMLATLPKLGVIPSFSRPSVINDNPYSESLFRTMKKGRLAHGSGDNSLDARRL